MTTWMFVVKYFESNDNVDVFLLDYVNGFFPIRSDKERKREGNQNDAI